MEIFEMTIQNLDFVSFRRISKRNNDLWILVWCNNKLEKTHFSRKKQLTQFTTNPICYSILIWCVQSKILSRNTFNQIFKRQQRVATVCEKSFLRKCLNVGCRSWLCLLTQWKPYVRFNRKMFISWIIMFLLQLTAFKMQFHIYTYDLLALRFLYC